MLPLDEPRPRRRALSRALKEVEGLLAAAPVVTLGGTRPPATDLVASLPRGGELDPPEFRRRDASTLTKPAPFDYARDRRLRTTAALGYGGSALAALLSGSEEPALVQALSAVGQAFGDQSQRATLLHSKETSDYYRALKEIEEYNAGIDEEERAFETRRYFDQLEGRQSLTTSRAEAQRAAEAEAAERRRARLEEQVATFGATGDFEGYARALEGLGYSQEALPAMVAAARVEYDRAEAERQRERELDRATINSRNRSNRRRRSGSDLARAPRQASEVLRAVEDDLAAIEDDLANARRASERRQLRKERRELLEERERLRRDLDSRLESRGSAFRPTYTPSSRVEGVDYQGEPPDEKGFGPSARERLRRERPDLYQTIYGAGTRGAY